MRIFHKYGYQWAMHLSVFCLSIKHGVDMF